MESEEFATPGRRAVHELLRLRRRYGKKQRGQSSGYKLRVIIPINCSSYNQEVKDCIDAVCPPDLTVAVTNISQGSDCIECRFDLVTNAPHVVGLVEEAREAGHDGVYVSDFDMCGVEAAHEVVDIPVIGGGRPQNHAAMMLSQRFTVLTIVTSVEDLQIEHMRAFGVLPNFASIRVLDISVKDLTNRKAVIEAATKGATDAIEEDGADSIIFGCTGFVGVAGAVAKKLSGKYGNVPVTDPNQVAVLYMYMLLRAGLHQSRLSYSRPALTS